MKKAPLTPNFRWLLELVRKAGQKGKFDIPGYGHAYGEREDDEKQYASWMHIVYVPLSIVDEPDIHIDYGTRGIGASEYGNRGIGDSADLAWALRRRKAVGQITTRLHPDHRAFLHATNGCRLFAGALDLCGLHAPSPDIMMPPPLNLFTHNLSEKQTGRLGHEIVAGFYCVDASGIFQDSIDGSILRRKKGKKTGSESMVFPE